MTAAIVIPAFNEADSIAAVVTVVSTCGTPVVVDDGSSDATGAQAEAAGALVVRQSENRGYDAALSAGFAKADEIGAEFIVTADADGQLDTAAIPLILEQMRNGPAHMILGTRDSGAARWSEALFNRYTKRRFGVPDILCGMKGFRTDIYRSHRACMDLPSVYTALALALLRRKCPFALVPVSVRARPGRSRFGGAWKANVRIAQALARAIRDDFAAR